MPKASYQKMLRLRLSPPQAQELRQIALDSRKGTSALIRETVRQFIKRTERDQDWTERFERHLRTNVARTQGAYTQGVYAYVPAEDYAEIERLRQIVRVSVPAFVRIALELEYTSLIGVRTDE